MGGDGDAPWCEGGAGRCRAAAGDDQTAGNTSAASIPIAIHDAVREGVIDRPLRVFAPGFGAGAVGGYVIMRVDPSIVA